MSVCASSEVFVHCYHRVRVRAVVRRDKLLSRRRGTYVHVRCASLEVVVVVAAYNKSYNECVTRRDRASPLSAMIDRMCSVRTLNVCVWLSHAVYHLASVCVCLCVRMRFVY